jgi:dienelactone hydrolase
MTSAHWRLRCIGIAGAVLLAACGGEVGDASGAPALPVAPPPAQAVQTGAAAGLFVLDSPLGTYRDGNLRDYDFVAGYAWRYGWSLMESAQDSYDFAALDHLLARVAARHQKLSWIIMPTPAVSAEPAYVLANAATWMDLDGVKRALPWDAFVIARYQAFFNALAAHRVADPAQGGALVPLGEHSAFYAINVTFPGVPNLALRDKRDAIVDIPGYTRAAFQNAIVAYLRAARAAFPRQHIHFGFWKFRTDADAGEAWLTLQNRIQAEFGNTVGVFMDNLAAARACVGCDPYTGLPVTDFAAPLVIAKANTYTAFQALTSWSNPSGDAPDKVQNGTPMDGIDFAFSAYNSRYVELYVNDVDRTDWHAGLRAAAATLVATRTGSTPAADTHCAAFTVTGDATSTNGATWSYASTDDGVPYSLTGTFFAPAGAGPFPAVVISHGAGGSAASYSASVAQVMRSWGLVAIAANYTHAGNGAATGLPDGAFGASDANVLRAHKTRNLLGCLGNVDMQRLAAHGHSMGAFVTGQLLGTYPNDFRTASHSAGGANANGPNATRSVVAANIRTPYQLHHGDADTVVNIALDQELDRILTASGVAHTLITYSGFTHEQLARDAGMLERVRAWYALYGVL